MKVVLALAPVWESVTPHLALAFLKGSLQKAGYECRCIDFSIQFRPFMVSALGDEGAEAYIASHPRLYQNWAKQICDEKPDIVGFSLLGSNLANTAWVAQEVKKILPNVMILSGGPSLTRENAGCIENALDFSDYVIEGEGEQAIVEFTRCFEQRGDFTKMKQLWMRDEEGKLAYTGHTNLQLIDNIPYPDFTDFDRRAYPCPDKLPLLFSRGCILNCNYCENKWNHLTQRSRTGQNVFEELRYHTKKYNIKEYMFNDDSLISSKTMRQLDEYCDLVISEGLVMPWSVYGTRVERLITQPFLNKLRRSGMERVSLGVESFSSRVQKEMGKSSRYDDADKMCRLFSGEGIRTESWIIYGYPTETEADFDETLQWFVKNPNILSHVTANAFGPNDKYKHDRPGVVTYTMNNSWGWIGLESTIEKRKQRFLAFIEVLESIRRSRKGSFTFHFGDPLYVKYFSSWTAKDKEFLLRSWEQLENPELQLHQPNNGIKKVLQFFGIGEREPIVPVKKPIRKEVLIVGEGSEMKEELFSRIQAHLNTVTTLTDDERAEKLEQYKTYFDGIRQHINDNLTEQIVLALSLKGPVSKMLEDFDTHAPEYVVQMGVDALDKYTIKEKTIS